MKVVTEYKPLEQLKAASAGIPYGSGTGGFLDFFQSAQRPKIADLHLILTNDPTGSILCISQLPS